MRTEEDDGVRECCAHGVPLICECPKCNGEARSDKKLHPVERVGHIKGDWYEWHVTDSEGRSGSSEGNHDFSFNSGEFHPDQT